MAPERTISVVGLGYVGLPVAVAFVAHREYKGLPFESFLNLMNSSPLLIDVKGMFDREVVQEAGVRFWRL